MTVRRTTVRAAAAAVALAGLAGPLALAGAPAQAATPGRAAATERAAEVTRSAVVSGKARFEVLSPTLVRTEYAEDGHFDDGPTFNAVGRDDFAATPFRTTTSGGWVTIKTSRMTVRYREGSGPFDDQNLQVVEQAGGQRVHGAPWPAAVRCEAGTRCEAEDQRLDGPGVATDHRDYSGSGFVAGFSGTGDAVGTTLRVPAAGTYDLAVRYANNRGGDGQLTTRSLSVVVDGGEPHRLSLPPTDSWDTWQVARVALDLGAGDHRVSLVRTASDSGNVNVDNLALVAPGAAYPDPAAPPAAQPCTFGEVCQAETGELAGGAKPAVDHDGYSGDGFVGGLEQVGAQDTLTVTGVPTTAHHRLQLRYASYVAGDQPAQDRTVSVQVGRQQPRTVTLPPTTSWNAWRTVSLDVRLTKGTDTVRIGCPDAQSCHLNLDTASFVRRGGPVLSPHAALGGYRRGLDNVDGGTTTAPGLLYQDGWSLLDDTASALWKPGADTVTQRDHDGDYQDGYVFGYGHDYARGLADLSTLTGPTKLLPRWTYGVWYSEYFDRTQQDFTQILARSRAEHMPLDVMVVDTDWKDTDPWNGWEVDTAKFPDVDGFFSLLHSSGVHTSFNIHPSISAKDPRYAQAQSTAGGALAPGSCGGGAQDCHVFDWGDPAQLQAYLDLHKPLDDSVDFWWLDWCCDGSSSSLPGVTPDAWINQQYATHTAPRTKRGFAFSRAYGSLQAGGYGSPTAVPTGPWADKRTTLHFTGDTISDWATLHYEVGYTPGESVATGNASVTHDIGGHTGGERLPGAEPGSTQLSPELYARWVQMGTFQPVDRLHSNHSDRLPWQYPAAARQSATDFLNLRERLVPLTYTLAHQAHEDGAPIVRPLYLEYPEQQEAYARAGGEYLYGPDVLVAPVTSADGGDGTTVWFPPGSTWTDWFTGKTYHGGTTASIKTDLSTMPVFVRSGGIVTTRTDDVSHTSERPLDDVTLTVATGQDGASSLYEDDGESADLSQSATTRLAYREDGGLHRLVVDRRDGSFSGAVERRAWTVRFTGASRPSQVSIDGRPVGHDSWTWDAGTRTLSVHVPAGSVDRKRVVDFR